MSLIENDSVPSHAIESRFTNMGPFCELVRDSTISGNNCIEVLQITLMFLSVISIVD